MSEKEKKYLDDEQVKKNLDRFKNDRENFVKDSKYLGLNSIDYGKNSVEKSNIAVDKYVKNGFLRQKKVKGKDNYLWIPKLLSIIVIIGLLIVGMYPFLALTSFSSELIISLLIILFVSFFIAKEVPIAVGIILSIWFFYAIWFLIKKYIFKDREGCEIKSFLLVSAIIVFIIAFVLYYFL